MHEKWREHLIKAGEQAIKERKILKLVVKPDGRYKIYLETEVFKGRVLTLQDDW